MLHTARSCTAKTSRLILHQATNTAYISIQVDVITVNTVAREAQE